MGSVTLGRERIMEPPVASVRPERAPISFFGVLQVVL
jgi:hypothetical protein